MALVASYINGFVVETKEFNSVKEAQEFIIRATRLQDSLLSVVSNAVLSEASFELLTIDSDRAGDSDRARAHIIYDLIPRFVLESDKFRKLIAIYCRRADFDDIAVDWFDFNRSYFDQLSKSQRVNFVIDALIEQGRFARDLSLILQSKVFKTSGLIQILNIFVETELEKINFESTEV